jgi:DNA-binding response OmpR family regulator
VGDLELDVARYKTTRAGQSLELSPKEFQLLSELALRDEAAFLRGIGDDAADWMLRVSFELEI